MATLKPPESQLLKTLISILTSEKTHLLETLNPYIPQITQPLLSSLLSSPSLAKKPETLVSFFQWAQTSIPEAFPSNSPLPLLSVVRSLLSHHKFADAKSLLADAVKLGLVEKALATSSLFFGLSIDEKLKAYRIPGNISGYTAAHSQRFSSNLPWNETLTLAFKKGPTRVVEEYLTSRLGNNGQEIG